VNWPVADTADCCTPISTDDEIRFEHLLNRFGCAQEGKQRKPEHLHASGPAESCRPSRKSPPRGCFRSMSDLRLVQMQNGEVQLTPVGSPACARCRAPSRWPSASSRTLFPLTIPKPHASMQIRAHHQPSGQRICTFLGHPKTCPHGNPIPPVDCWTASPRADRTLLSCRPLSTHEKNQQASRFTFRTAPVWMCLGRRSLRALRVAYLRRNAPAPLATTRERRRPRSANCFVIESSPALPMFSPSPRQAARQVGNYASDQLLRWPLHRIYSYDHLRTSVPVRECAKGLPRRHRLSICSRSKCKGRARRSNVLSRAVR